MKKPMIYLEKMKGQKQHNKTTCLVENTTDVEEKLNQLFQDKEPYMKKVIIQTSKKTFETRIYERRGQELVTLDHQIIPLNDIISIKRIS